VKRTLVERVAKEVDDFMFCWPSGHIPPGVLKSEAKHIIAMVRRHDRKEKGK
jgi:hypothetical protein